MWPVVLRGVVTTLALLGLFIAGIVSAADAYSLWRTERSGVRGTIMITECRPHHDEDPLTWTCHGVFTSPDGPMRIERVRLVPDIESPEQPEGTWTASVRDKGAETAVQPGHWRDKLGLVLGIIGGIGFAWVGWTTTVFILEQWWNRDKQTRPRRRPVRLRVCQTAITLLCVLVTAGIFASSTGPIACTEAASCLPDPLGSVSFGALLAACFTAWISPWAAALGASVFSLGLLLKPGVDMSPLSYAMLAGFAAVVCLLAAIAQPPARAANVDIGQTRALPALRRPPHIGGAVWLAVLLGAGTVFAGIGLWWQYRADAQAARAEVVSATVESHDGDGHIRLRLPNEDLVAVPVLSQENYPVGSTVRIRWDRQGLAQPLAEPYDSSLWLTLATLFFLPGVGVHLRRWQASREWRRLSPGSEPSRAEAVPPDIPQQIDRNVHVHRFDPIRAFLGAAIVPGILALPLLGSLGPLSAVQAWAISVVTAGALVTAWWWLVVRPVILWNRGGVTIANHTGVHKYPWHEVDRIEPMFGYVRITTHDGRHASITSGGDIATDRKGVHAALTLCDRLELAKAQADRAVEPPAMVPRPGATIAMPLAFAVVTIAMLFILQR